VASSGSLKQQIKPVKKIVKIVLNKKMPSGKHRVARSEPRQQAVTTKQQIAVEQQVKPTTRFGDSRFDPYSIGTPRRLSRRERLQLYYGGSAQLPPPGYYRAAPPPQAYRRYYDAR